MGRWRQRSEQNIYRPRKSKYWQQPPGRSQERGMECILPSDLPEGPNPANILISNFWLPKPTQKKPLRFSPELVLICYSRNKHTSLTKTRGLPQRQPPRHLPAQAPQGEAHCAGPTRPVRLHLTEEPEAQASHKCLRPRSQETAGQGSGHRWATSGPVSSLGSMSVSTAVPAPPHQPRVCRRSWPQLLIGPKVAK